MGGLVYCMEFLLDNIEWLEENLGDYDQDYLIFDCPGQIEVSFMNFFSFSFFVFSRV